MNIPFDQRVGKLSSGQRALVSLTLALAKRPQLPLLNEPLAALDPLARRGAVTIVLSSHVITDLERVCDHLIVLDHRRVQVAGAVDDLLAEHTVLSGPADRAESLRRNHVVIGASTVGRQTIALVRGEAPRNEAWRAEPVGLEELVLTYLRNPHQAALPGPHGIVEKTVA